MSREIEVKYRVPDVDVLLAVLERQGVVLSAPVVQDDQAYAPASWCDDDARIGVTFVRLRRQDGVCIFTTKTPVDNVLACREFETVVDNPEQMHQAILAMGYRETVQVVKKRRTGQVGTWSLCLDDLDGAGAFLEVEAIADGDIDMVEMQTELDRWVQGLGAGVQRTGATYDQVVSEASA